MRILWLSWKSITHHDAGGAEIVGHENAKALVKAGHSVTWISLNPNNTVRITKDGVNYDYIGQRWMMYTGIFHILVFINYIINWRNNYDFIIDEIHGPPLMTPLFSQKPKLVVLHEVAGDIWQKTVPQPLSFIMQHIIEPFMFKAYAYEIFVVGAETTKDDVLKLGIRATQIKHIPYGVELPKNIHQYNFSKESVPTLMFLSALRPMKGFNRVYDAYKEIQKQIPTIQMWVVGDDTTEHAKQMKERIALEQTTGITFYGKVPQEKKFELLQRAHILVHGSYKEGWGLVVIEANAMGTPAVVFDAAGLRNSIQNGKTGYLAQDNNELKQYITKLLGDVSAYTKMQEEARSWSKQFSWTNATKIFINLVETIKNK